MSRISRCSSKVKPMIKIKKVSRKELRQMFNVPTPSISTNDQYKKTLTKSDTSSFYSSTRKRNKMNWYNSSDQKNSHADGNQNTFNVKNKCSQFRKIYLCFILLGGLLLAAIMAIIFAILFNKTTTTSIRTTTSMTTTTTGSSTTSTTKSTTTTSSSTTTTSSTTSTSVTTTSSTSTTTVTCPTGYTLNASGSCVDTQRDINNCGSIGYVCPSNYTSCVAGLCSTRPAVQLPGAIAIPSWSSLVSTVDDAVTTINLDVPLTLYNYSSTTITLSTNGVLCLGTCSNAYSNTNLPSSSFGSPSVFGFWDDLMIYPNTGQTVYYAVSGTAPNRTTTFEFYTSHYSSSLQYYHFQMIFQENQPNIVKCLYFETSDGGLSATIGVQKLGTGPAITYSFNQANAVVYNKTIVFNTNTGTFST